ncbi:MAG: initiation factor 2 [Firmicutes bacterium]|nr:initiation factor 2 [Bacillota bacterium]
MSKYRIYELAKEFNTESKVIIDILARNNMEAKNHMSSVGDDAKTVITRTFAHKMTTSANNVAPSVQIPQQQSVQTTPTMTNTPPQTRPAYNNQHNPSQNQTPRPAYNNQHNPSQNQTPRPAYNNQQNPGQSRLLMPITVVLEIRDQVTLIEDLNKIITIIVTTNSVQHKPLK